jgi:cytochrome c oxidase assembly protein subunit 20
MASNPEPPQDPRVVPPGTTIEQNKSWLETNKAEVKEKLVKGKKYHQIAEVEAPQPTPAGPTVSDLGEAIKTIKPSDFLSVHQTPCARQGILAGIGAGAAVGALRIVLRSMCRLSRSTRAAGTCKTIKLTRVQVQFRRQ